MRAFEASKKSKLTPASPIRKYCRLTTNTKKSATSPNRLALPALHHEKSPPSWAFHQEMVQSELVANAQAHAFDIEAIFFVHLHPIQTAINILGKFQARTQSVGE